jgi:hypothetical protein
MEEVRLLESQNMSQGQATNFPWHTASSNGLNDMFNMAFTSCTGTDVHAISEWPCYSICCVEITLIVTRQVAGIPNMSYIDVSWSQESPAFLHESSR